MFVYLCLVIKSGKVNQRHNFIFHEATFVHISDFTVADVVFII